MTTVTQRHPILVGGSPPMQRLRDRVTRFARCEEPVLLYGESGAGKELTARALHSASPRHRGPFVPVNCGAIPRELVQSELFGTRRGAFTGAHERRGFITRADGGTLFLDEIGELALPAQVALLRVLDGFEVCPVGGEHARKVNVRVVSATHRNLVGMVGRGQFRLDLHQRLSALEIPVPPLRERPEDIPALASTLVGQDVTRLRPGAWAALRDHPWPGNVRELRNVLVRALAEVDGRIEATHL